MYLFLGLEEARKWHEMDEGDVPPMWMGGRATGKGTEILTRSQVKIPNTSGVSRIEYVQRWARVFVPWFLCGETQSAVASTAQCGLIFHGRGIQIYIPPCRGQYLEGI